jgi:hypothetical protein
METMKGDYRLRNEEEVQPPGIMTTVKKHQSPQTPICPIKNESDKEASEPVANHSKSNKGQEHASQALTLSLHSQPLSSTLPCWLWWTTSTRLQRWTCRQLSWGPFLLSMRIFCNLRKTRHSWFSFCWRHHLAKIIGHRILIASEFRRCLRNTDLE